VKVNSAFASDDVTSARREVAAGQPAGRAERRLDLRNVPLSGSVSVSSTSRAVAPSFVTDAKTVVS